MAAKSIVLITGGNTGIGLEVVRALAKTSTAYSILVGSRSVTKGEEAIETVKGEIPDSSSTFSVVQVDVTSDDSLEKATKTIDEQHGRLDILINNAGAGFDGQIASGALGIREAFNKSWDTNVTGTHVLTTLCVPLLLKSSNPRLLFVTSGTSTLTETERFDHPIFQRINASPPAGWPKEAGVNPLTSYRSTKTGLNMLMREWYKILKNDGVKIWAISPGFLATGLGGVGAEQLKKVCNVLCTSDME